MPLHLGGILVRAEAVSREQLDAAAQRQVLAGGSLDTCILELQPCDEEALGAALAEVTGLPLAPSDALERPAEDLDRLIPFALADRHGIVPFAQDSDGTHLACAYPISPALLEEIAILLREPIIAHVALEFRVRLAIEKLYRQQAAPRFHDIAAKMGTPVEPPELLAHPPPVDGDRHLPAEWSRMEAVRRMLQAADRDEAIDTLLRFARQSFDFVAAFVVQGKRAVGWDALGPEPKVGRAIEQVVFPLDSPSAFRTVALTHGRYLGPLRTQEEQALWETLGRKAPRSVFVQPITIGDRLVALFLGENGAGVIRPQRVAQVMIVGHALGMALERMIMSRKAEMEAAAGGADEGEVEGIAPIPASAENAEAQVQAHMQAQARSATLDQARVAVERFLAARGDEELLAAMEELRRVGSIAAELLVALLPGEEEDTKELRGHRVAHGLLELGPAAVPALKSAAASPLPGKRNRASRLLEGNM